MAKIAAEQVPVSDGTVESGSESGDSSIAPGQKFKVGGEVYEYTGIVEDEASADIGKPIGKPAEGEELYKVFDPEDMERGVFAYEAEELVKDIDENLPILFKEQWESECLNNSENNPDNIPMD